MNLLSGSVLNPGSYLMNDGDSILDVIEKSGGYTKNAYVFGAVYQNVNARDISEKALQKLYENSIQNISQLLKKNGSSEDYGSLIAMLTQLKATKVSGRIVVDLSSDKKSPLIQDGDSILIPETTNQVYIYGSVSDNGSALYTEGQNLDYYLEKKGGLTEEADKDNIFVLNPNGESYKTKISRNLFTSKDSKIKVYPGSIIYVPEDLDSSYQSMLAAQAYATILGNLGVSLASLAVIKD